MRVGLSEQSVSLGFEDLCTDRVQRRALRTGQAANVVAECKPIDEFS